MKGDDSTNVGEPKGGKANLRSLGKKEKDSGNQERKEPVKAQRDAESRGGDSGRELARGGFEIVRNT